ncbi:MAG: fructose-bisphosphate aldolase class I, partial [Actinomycetota bacterium]|nr:fructose-bisphosphate aldolase class I [Actinomycetota bacterium]
MADDLTTTAQALVAPGKGVLAADESTGTIGKRFAAIDIESTEESRRAYRDALLSTPDLAESISGVIMYDETIRQSTADGIPFPKMLADHGILPGIKVDTGAKDLALAPGEKVTEGLDGLRDRIAEYVELGAKFAKWRAVITIGDGIPSATCIDTNAHALARYAALCQEGGLVPIVEPEVLMDGDHSIERCFEVTEATQRAVFAALAIQRVNLEQMVLKPNMVLSGKDNERQADVEEVATQTLRCLRRTVPAAVPG